MAVEITPRLGIPRWPLGTDPYRREQRNLTADQLEALVAIDGQGTLAARPAAGTRGRYYFVTAGADAGRLFRDDGAAWSRVGADADTLDGLDSSAFLPAGGTAYDSDRLGGVAAPLYLLASDANAAYVARAEATTATVAAGEATTSTSYTDLATAGPAVTLATGTRALVILGGAIANDTVGQGALMAVAVSGATTRAATNGEALSAVAASVNQTFRMSRVLLMTGLTAGSNTFTAKYLATGGTATFTSRDITVIPF